MTAISNEKSVFAIVKQTEEDTLNDANASNATAIQSGFTIEPAFAELTSEELSGSIGAAKGEIGAEAPTASVSHYIRGSGEEGEQVDFSDLLEGALGGKTDAPAAESQTLAESTKELIKANPAAYIKRGALLLVKDAVNGYSARNVLSVMGNDISLAQALKEAPGAGVMLGRPVGYFPDDEPPFFSAHLFRGNGGVREAISAAYITEMSIEATAGEYINGSFSMAGREYFYNPIIVTTDVTFVYETDTVTIKAGVYKDPHEFAAAVQTALVASGNNQAETCAYLDASGKFKITVDTASDFDFSSGGAGAILGFGTQSLMAETEIESAAINLAASGNLAYDTEGPLVAKDIEILIGNKGDIECFNAATFTSTITNTKVDAQDMCSKSGIGSSRISERVIETEIAGQLNRYDADKFRRFRKGENTMFTANLGRKSGGNWVPGKGFNICSMNSTITAFTIEDADGLAQMSMTLRSFVEGGLGEFYMNTF